MKRFTIGALMILLAAPAWCQEGTPAYHEVDYAKIDRSIAKEPAYRAQPLYALFLFGVKGDVPMWAVLDKSDPELAWYDVLYLDRNANGDLTEAGERLQAAWDEEGARAGMAVVMRIDPLPVPGTDLVHRKFLISTVRKSGRTGIWFRMQWNGVHEMSGGYGLLGSNATAWAASPARAPILRPDPTGTLTFATWGDDRIAIPIGGERHVNVIAGNRGSGPDTLAVVDDKFLDLEKEELWLTVIGRTASGAETRAATRITGHC